MNIAILTSRRAVSLKKVAQHIEKILNENDIETTIYEDAIICATKHEVHDGLITVMPVDLAWCMPHIYTTYRYKASGKPAYFYGTVEGRIMGAHGHAWISRDIEFIANSEYTAKKLKEVSFRIKDIIPHGIFLEDYLVDDDKRIDIRNKTRDEYGFKQDDFLVLYIASGHRRKCHDLASRTAKSLAKKDPTIKLVVVTDDNGAKRYSNLDNVVIIRNFGGLSELDIRNLYIMSDLYAQFSCSEGFGMPVLEALACGLMVVHPDYKPLSEITTKDTSVRVEIQTIKYYRELSNIEFELHMYDPVEFANAIIKAKEIVLTDRESITKKAIERAKEFDARKLYSKFIPLLKH